ncbi:MAG: PQQ-binding-like beta-propeller repeat protein [Alphaproteobacteria bacterium]|nr:PQQ-binding-like beta-propeller repeat protein [Alphaproteobacteria bacterium]
MKHSYLLAAASALVLSACSENKPPLKGTRINFIQSAQFVPCPSLAHKKVVPGAAVANQQWPMQDQNQSQLLTPLKAPLPTAVKWQQSIGGGISSGKRFMPNMVGLNGFVYTLSPNQQVSCFDAVKGTEVWTYQPENNNTDILSGGLSIHQNQVITTNAAGDITALDAKNGQVLWTKNIESPVRVQPTIHQGLVYVLTTANEIFALDFATGNIQWQYQGMSEISALLGGAEPVVYHNHLIAAFTSGEYAAFDPKTGALQWSDMVTASLRADTVSSMSHIIATPVVDKDVAYVLSHGGKLLATDLKTGNRLWQQNVAGVQQPAIVGDFLCVLSDTDELICLEKLTGKVKYAVQLKTLHEKTDQKEFYFGPQLVRDQLLVTTSSGGMLFLNPNDGALVHTFNVDAQVSRRPVIMNEVYYFITNDGDVIAY